jgi:hypothetical protein
MPTKNSAAPNRFAVRFAGFLFAVAFCGASLWLAPLAARAFRGAPQQTNDAPHDEVVANLASGRVVIAVVKDAILIGTIENPIEPETRPPVPVQISTSRVGVLLGPVDWVSVPAHVPLANLDRELPHLRAQLVKPAPSLNAAQGGGEATDIQAIGQGLLERLNVVAGELHGKFELPEKDPLAVLVLADYLPSYGPEIWQLSYPVQQLQQHGEYWDTRVLRPQYLQYWPPEKGEPHTLVEFHYPPEDKSPTLLELLKDKDARIEQICASDAKMKEVADRILDGQIGKASAADSVQFLRAALNAMAPAKSRETMAAIGAESGFEWILAPPPEPKPQGSQPQRPEGAPSLLNPGPH